MMEVISKHPVIEKQFSKNYTKPSWSTFLTINSLPAKVSNISTIAQFLGVRGTSLFPEILPGSGE